MRRVPVQQQRRLIISSGEQPFIDLVLSQMRFVRRLDVHEGDGGAKGGTTTRHAIATTKRVINAMLGCSQTGRHECVRVAVKLRCGRDAGANGA